MSKKPTLFIGSSVENIHLAHAVQTNLEHQVEATVWDQNVFAPSAYVLEALLEKLDSVDFGLVVFAPDDVVEIRGTRAPTIRDNVIFELGLFIGRLGRERSMIVAPRTKENVRIPTDLHGVVHAEYSADRSDGNWGAALGPACDQVRRAIASVGPRVPIVVVKPIPYGEILVSGEGAPPVELFGDENDCISILETWWIRQPNSSPRMIKLGAADRQLQLVPGSTKKYIEQVAGRYHYVVVRRGEGTVFFKHKADGN